MGDIIKLNLGCGNAKRPGAINVDLRGSPDIVDDCRNLEKFGKSFADCVESYHLIEHLPFSEIGKVLKRWFDILKPGGRLIIEAPDLKRCCENYLADPSNLKLGLLGIYGEQPGGPDGELMRHRWGYSPDSLGRLLKHTGFVDIVERPQTTHQPHRDFRLEARKPVANIYCIVIRTADRRLHGKRNYIAETVEGLFRSRIRLDRVPYEIHVFDSGSGDTEYLTPVRTFPGVKIHAAGDSDYSPNQNGSRALLYAEKASCDYVIFLEDDIAVCKHWLKGIDLWISKYLTQEMRVIVLYTPYMEVLKNYEDGIAVFNYPVERFYGTQAFAMRKNDATTFGKLVDEHARPEKIHDLKFKYLKGNRNGMINKCLDFWLKEWMGVYYPDLKYFHATCPSFVQHVGKESTMSGKRFHSCGSFQGADWFFDLGSYESRHKGK